MTVLRQLSTADAFELLIPPAFFRVVSDSCDEKLQ